jgi:hypothetical protein
MVGVLCSLQHTILAVATAAILADTAIATILELSPSCRPATGTYCPHL